MRYSSPCIHREVSVRLIAFTAALTALFLLSSAGLSIAAEPVACAALTQAQIASATGATVGAGSPIGMPTSCQWAGQGKIVTLVIRRPLAGKSPVDQFNDGKTRTLPGITTEPVSGVGDDAFYIGYAGANRAGLGLVVKKGSSAFEVRVYGFDLNQAKVVAKTLAQDAATKF
jgi:hypothetical protein